MSTGELGRNYTDGELIFREGDKGEMMYVIQAGRVRITKRNGAEDVTIATLESGEIFGEMSLFDKLPRSATASAFGDARILSIDRKKLFSTISRDPTLVFKILDTMSQRIRRLNESVTAARERHASSLEEYIDLEHTCRMVLDEARTLVQADNGSVMLLDNEGRLSIRAAFGTEASQKMSLVLGEGIAGDVLRTGRAELVNNVSMDSRFKPGGKTQVASLLCAPIKHAGQNLGVINVSNSADRIFAIEDLKLIHSLSVYAAVAIQNAKNFVTLKEMTDRILVNATILDTL